MSVRTNRMRDRARAAMFAARAPQTNCAMAATFLRKLARTYNHIHGEYLRKLAAGYRKKMLK